MSTILSNGLAFLDATALQPILLQAITLQITGFILLLIFMGIGGYIGYLRGFRALLTITLVSIIAYLTCVRGGEELVAVINRLYVNAPRLVAFAAGRDPGTVEPLDTLIVGFQVPLFFRVVLFFSLIAFGWFFNARPGWYSANPNTKAEPLARILGALNGAFIAILWSNGLTVFWQEFVADGGGFEGPVAAMLNILPDLSVLIPSLITVFFILLFVIILFNLPKIWNS
jgi:hypothetical protein